MNSAIEEKTRSFPRSPGVYVFLGSGGEALYVGKASNLRSRVRSYLKPGGDGRPQLYFLAESAVDVEFLVTRTEQEALLLEDTIIKKRKPRYNVKLKDDKAFLMLRIDRREEWPWYRLVRRRRADGAEYFGPYASAKAVRRSLGLLHKVVPLRDCSDGVFHNRSRPCIKHQIGRCPAPCVGAISHSEYASLVEQSVRVLRGGAQRLARSLEEQMRQASDALEFERAQALKTQIQALDAVVERQAVVGPARDDQDVVALHRHGDDRVTVALLFFRGGRLESSQQFELHSVLPDPLLVEEVLSRFYGGDRFVPPEVLVPVEPASSEMIADWLSEKRGSSVRLLVPQRGAKRERLAMAMENARLAREGGHGSGQGAAQLAELLDLVEAPERIHCLDVSTIQGRNTVASRVSFRDGRPEKDLYRRFRISAEAAGDDFAAMREAVLRSLRQSITKEESLPDLLLIDGGKGQLRSACDAAAELGVLDDLVLAGLAKSRLRGLGDERRGTDERLFLPGGRGPVTLPPAEPATLLAAAVRDEAHRFAITYHRKLRGSLTSALDRIPGVGPARRRTLLRTFGSLEGVTRASLEELRAVVPDAVAEAVYEGLQRSSES